jgi:hypothetical protein
MQASESLYIPTFLSEDLYIHKYTDIYIYINSDVLCRLTKVPQDRLGQGKAE